MSKLLIFAGTTEGRRLAEWMQEQGESCIVCVATEYGEALIEEKGSIHRVIARRLDAEEMAALMRENGITHVVDATHPYATVVTDNIKQAAGETGCIYLRLLRESAADSFAADYISVGSVDEAVAYLRKHPGKIFASTGSKELHKYTEIENYKERVTARILSTRESVEIAVKLGFEGKNLICMQGPFSEDMNTAMLQAAGADYLVTKESGKAGGFPEKVRAAKRAGAKLIVVGRPQSPDAKRESMSPTDKSTADMSPTDKSTADISTADLSAPDSSAAGTFTGGMSMDEICARIITDFALQPRRRITLIGIGMGTKEGMTREAWDALQKADLIAGSGRMLEPAAGMDVPKLDAYKAEEIKAFADAHPGCRNIVILLSGDVGFYSGAKKLEAVFAGEDLHRICGISSLVYFCGLLHTSWEDAYLVSIHGRNQNIVAAVRSHKKVFALVGKQESFDDLCRLLVDMGLGEVKLSAGSDLSYPSQRIWKGTAASMAGTQVGDLTVVLLENDQAQMRVTHGIPDEAFLRAKVPMTKEEIRSISLSRLRLAEDSVIYDVGAGTGSLSIEMALRAAGGMVYAIEKKEEAVELIRQNACRFGVTNLEVVSGYAPEALTDLPAPTHVFIGGSSGNMQQIVKLLLEKNPRVRIVINAIALETIHEAMECIRTMPLTDVEISCVQVSRGKQVASYHMMMGQNPVYVISCSGAGEGI